MGLVKVINTLNHAVGVYIPELNFKRTWAKRGAIIKIDKDKLEEMMYDPGFSYMLEQGVLYVEDMEVKKELGLEPETATEPENIIVLSDKDQRAYMIKLTQEEFEEKVAKLSHEQVVALAEYAIVNKLSDMNKCAYLKKLCGRDVIESIKNSAED